MPADSEPTAGPSETALPTAEPDLTEQLRSAPELRLIGRRIRLRMGDFGFEGLVSYVTKTTVVLMQCEKLTLEQQELRQQVAADHAEARDRVRRINRRRRARRQRERRAAQAQQGTQEDSVAPSRSPPPESVAVPVPAEDDDHAADEGQDDADAAEVETELLKEPEIDAELQEAIKENVASFPFCTFTRRRIHDVRLMENRDREPTDEQPGDQLLRAHVRRYIIHSALGNTNGVSMTSFLGRRLGWRDVDGALVSRVEEEEQGTVELLAAEVSKDRLAQQRQRAAQMAALGDASGDDNTPGRRPLRPRRGPGGTAPFGDHLTEEETARLPFIAVGLHSRTMYVGVLHLILAIVVLLYAAVVFSTAEGAVVSPFVATFSTWVAGCATLQLVEAASVGLQSLRLRHPIPRKATALRVVILVASLGFLAPTMYVTSSAAYDYRQPIGGQTAESLYIAQVQDTPQTICTYSAKKRCSGWDIPCSIAPSPFYCPDACSNVVNAQTVGCRGEFQTEIGNVVIPVCVFNYMALFVFAADVWHFIRYIYIALHPNETLQAAALREARRQLQRADGAGVER